MVSAGSFTEKLLNATFTLAEANFPSTQNNTLELQGLRMAAKVTTVNRQGLIGAIEIWGMKQADMNALTMAWSQPNSVIMDNTLVIKAGTKGNLSTVFQGSLLSAQPNYASAPEVSFVAQANGAYYISLLPYPDSSWNGDVSIVKIAEKLLADTGLSVVSNGATGTLKNQKLTGSRWDQFMTACESTETDWYLLGDKVVLVNQNEPYSSIPTMVLSPNTGLIGYPMLDRAGLQVKSLFDPALTAGSAIEIRNSIVPYANGKWFPQKVEHMLEANLPGGVWQSEMFCLRID